jgi:hypothetical protein
MWMILRLNLPEIHPRDAQKSIKRNQMNASAHVMTAASRLLCII